MAKYECQACGFVYDEDKEGKKWEELPDDWTCPVCGVGKDMFQKLPEKKPEKKAPEKKKGK